MKKLKSVTPDEIFLEEFRKPMGLTPIPHFIC